MGNWVTPNMLAFESSVCKAYCSLVWKDSGYTLSLLVGLIDIKDIRPTATSMNLGKSAPSMEGVWNLWGGTRH